MIASGGNILFDARWIDAPAVCQHPALLSGVKGDLIAIKYRLERFGLMVSQAVDELVALQCLRDDFGGIVRLHFLVLNPHGLNCYPGCLGTKAMAACSADFHLIYKILAFDFFS